MERLSSGCPKSFQISSNRLLDLRRFHELFLQRRGEAFHPVLERFAVVFGFLRAYVAARCEDEAVRADFFELHGFAEAGDVLVLTARCAVRTPQRGIPTSITAPHVICSSDFLDVLVREFAVDAVNHSTEFSRINEQRFATPVA